jgi:ferric-dicitrate binding protein FerR (iron transport regulator)
MNKITEQQFHDLLALKLSGDATVVQLALLQEQLLLNPQWQFLYDQVMQPSPFPPNIPEQAQQAYAAHFVNMQLQGKLDDTQPAAPSFTATVSPRRSLSRRMTYVLAAAAIIGILLFITILKPAGTSPGGLTALNEIATKKGSKSNIKLPDGTQVWLNADSKLIYKENFSGATREVTLTGEAYFDVAHDTSHPFIIHTGKASVRVLGTAFNIRNYPQDKSMETTLMRGKIEISFTDRPGEKIIMKPLEKLIIQKQRDTPEKTTTGQPSPPSPGNSILLTSLTYSNRDSIVAETSWMSDKMVFINQPLEKIAGDLERHFAITIILRNTEARQFRYTGAFDDVSLDRVLQILQLSKKINYKIENRTVIIY